MIADLTVLQVTGLTLQIGYFDYEGKKSILE